VTVTQEDAVAYHRTLMAFFLILNVSALPLFAVRAAGSMQLFLSLPEGTACTYSMNQQERQLMIDCPGLSVIELSNDCVQDLVPRGERSVGDYSVVATAKGAALLLNLAKSNAPVITIVAPEHCSHVIIGVRDEAVVPTQHTLTDMVLVTV